MPIIVLNSQGKYCTDKGVCIAVPIIVILQMMALHGLVG